ncbi:STAS domain-containing protein, partial [Streptomyces sp. NPDC006324]|uniref:STAS domain-containing protein n=1 Tax=Streptomyces sp. NPDC006324 TaxID=3156751 RepID=UPI0033BD26CC
MTLQGEIDHTAKDTLTDILVPRNEAAVPLRVVADLTGVTFMDSSGINALILAHQHLTAQQGGLRITGAQEAVGCVLGLIGVDTVPQQDSRSRTALVVVAHHRADSLTAHTA